MNFFGISISGPTPQTIPLSLQEAPLRPRQSILFGTAALSLPFACIASVFNPNLFFESLGVLGVIASLVLPLTLWRRYNRVGWYERHEVVIPELPFEMRGNGQRIVFGTETITFSTFFTPNRTISYTQILDVYTDCKGDCLSGIVIGLTRKGYCNVATAPQSISDSGDGERTRIALAVLRAKAPLATSCGPKWIEDGWVPRLGFSHPNYGGGGGV